MKKLYTFLCYDLAGNTDIVEQIVADTIEEAEKKFEERAQAHKYELEINEIFEDELDEDNPFEESEQECLPQEEIDRLELGWAEAFGDL